MYSPDKSPFLSVPNSSEPAALKPPLPHLQRLDHFARYRTILLGAYKRNSANATCARVECPASLAPTSNSEVELIR